MAKMRPSEFFEDAVMEGGTIVATCDFCGREHFATGDTSCYDKGELELLKKRAKKEPDRYIEHPESDSIGIGTINERQAVIGCSCDGLANWEEWILSNRFVIAKYLKAWSKNQLERAQKEVTDMNIQAFVDS